ncbi:BORA family protein [Megaselia abdita]
MEWSKSTTPQKPFEKNHQSSPVLNFLKKCGNTPRTPVINGNRKTSMSGLFPVLRTPDGSKNRIPKVKNPFEASLTERYHLPTISSPSMFQRPLTPQHCSTQFEWTIDEVSSLGPANLEPHETQFIDSPDPELEAKAQAAISSFFKEQKIVPSPFVDNNIMSSTTSELRRTETQSIHFQAQRVILAHISGNTPVSKPGRRIRDSSSQTILSFPPILPPEVEEILKPFFNFQENQQQELDYQENFVDYEARDALLRRKLFDINDYQDIEEPIIYEYDHFSPPPKSPELDSKPFNDSLDKNSFGSLSPISKLDRTKSPSKESPSKSNSAINNDISRKRKSSFLNSSFTSDRKTPTQFRYIQTKNISGSFRNSPNDGCSSEGTPGTVINGSLYRSTPGLLCTRRSSSPCFESNVSIDRSVNKRISQLVMHSAKRVKAEITDLFKEDDETEDEEMQLSQFSSSIESPVKTTNAEHTDTPRGSQQKRRVRAKNLSQSFTMHSEDEEYEKVDKENDHFKTIHPCSSSSTSTFYRTDSGFNELTQSSTASQEIVDYENKLNLIPNMDQSMTLTSKLVI